MAREVARDETPRSGAALRVMGNRLDFDEISRGLGANATHTHRAGDLDLLRKPYPTDMWMLESPLDPVQPLEAHVSWLHAALSPRYEFLVSLQRVNRVDIYCSFACFSEQNSLKFSPDSLRIFTSIKIPLEISIILVPLEYGNSSTGPTERPREN